jgi:hypothetical protein
VYALIDPESNVPFYFGKGNRVFHHVALSLDKEATSDKYEKIVKSGKRDWMYGT